MVKYIYIAIIVVISLIAFFTYAADKRKAKKGAWRIPEKVLLGLSFFGGAVGGYLSMYLFHHKTRKWYFQLINLLGLAWQIALGVYFFLA